MGAPDYAALKKGGFMRQIQKDRFSLRLRVAGGQLTVKQLEKINEVAQKFGKGGVHLTSRQGVEIPFIALEDVDAVKASLAEAGLSPGACGPRVRTVTACQGKSICPSGLIETSDLARELDARYFGRELPHKFKIGVTGCPNNCLKAEENDLGIKGAVVPAWQSAACCFCGVCASVCPAKAITVDKEGKKLEFNQKECAFCGKCVKSCPTDAWKGKNAYQLSFGGLFGNEIKTGKKLLPPLFKKEAVFKAADLTLAFFQERGKAGERFGRMLGRLGDAALEQHLCKELAGEFQQEEPLRDNP